MKIIITEEQYNNIIDNLTFLGYHSSKRELKSGFYKGSVLNENYDDIIRYAYMEIISDYDENLENDNFDGMRKTFDDLGYGFTFVSKTPIKASSWQSDEYKYGNNLYKVYGHGDEHILDDPNEINAEIIVSKNPLYFEKYVENINERFYYNEDPQFLDNDIYDYQPTQDEIDQFIKHKYQLPVFSSNNNNNNNNKPNNNDKPNKVKTGIYILYSKIDGEIAHGSFPLMRWKKNQMINKNPLNKHILKIIPQKKSI